MFFPTAGIDVPVWVPPLVAFGISFCTSMGGVSGAFLLLPFQMSVLGYTHPSVSATNQLFNVVAIPSGVWRYWREGRMVWPLSVAVILGTLPGVVLGGYLRLAYLPDPRRFKLFAAAVLAYIGVRLTRDVVRRAGGPTQSGRGTVLARPWNWRWIAFSFQGREYRASVWGVFLLTLVVGIVGGVYGIGGGAIVAPFFVSFLEMPVYAVAGAALLGTLVTSVVGVLWYQMLAPWYPHLSVAPDWALGGLFGLGGMAGMYLGARCQRFVPARIIKAGLVVVLLGIAAKYVVEYFR
jgi:uncharacterized membrane protein YfcA